MARRDNCNQTTYKQLLAYAATSDNTAYTTSIIDTANALSVTLLLHMHVAADADMTGTLVVSDSDDSGMSGGAAVADEYLIGTEAGTALAFDSETKVAKIGYTGHKRYIQAVWTPANNTGNISMSGIVALERANPVGNSTQLAITTA